MLLSLIGFQNPNYKIDIFNKNYFYIIRSWGFLPQTPTKETFREKFLGTSKALPK